MGDYNGSAMMHLDNWHCGSANFFTPTIDATVYANDDDLVTLEFDVWVESNIWNAWYGADYLEVYAGSTMLEQFNTYDGYTYDNTNSYDFMWDPDPDGKYWRHVRLQVPKSARTSSMRIRFYGYAWNACGGNVGIDNVVITGTHYTTYSYTPTTINFGDHSVGDASGIQNVTLNNPNPMDVAVSNVSLTGADAAAFQIVSTPASIPAGTTSNPGKATIGVRFLAPSAKVHTASLNFTAAVDKNPNGAVILTGRAVAPLISAFETKSLFTKSRTRLGATRDTFVLVTHSSNFGKLVISPTTTIEGEYASQYSIVRIPSGQISPGQVDTIFVRHNPMEEGGRHAVLRIKSNAGNGDILVPLRGTGIIQRFAVDPISFSFDSTEMATTACQVFTLSNPGSDTLHIKGLYFATADPDFSMTGLSQGEMTIAPERSREITVCFRPQRMGTRVARVRILTDIPLTYETVRRDTSEYFIDIRGVGVPYGQLSFGSYRVDSTLVGQQVCQNDTVWNTGSFGIAVTSAQIIGPNASDFVLQNATFPININAGSYAVLTMCMTPGARGLRNASIVAFTMSNEKKDTIILPLSVFGQLACAKESKSALFHDAMVLVGQSDSQMVEISNCGDIATQYTVALANGTTAYQIVGSSMSPVVLPGGTHEFWVRFRPTERGAMTGNLTVTGESVAPMNIALQGTGAGVTANHASFTIPPTNVGSSNTFAVAITNNGNVAWNTGTPTISVSTYTTAWTGSTIQPNETENVTFIFNPAVEGSNSATVTFPNSSPLEAPVFVIHFTGQGLGVASVSPVVSSNGFSLEQNYPNPFSPSTKIRFSTPRAADVTIAIYDLKGEMVKMVTSGMYSEGSHEVDVTASDLVSGTYFYVLTSSETRLVQTMVVEK